jgi:hypothetical protein
MTEIRHVVFAPDGGWRVVEDDDGRPASRANDARRENGEGRHFERKREAVAHAKDLVREHGGGEVQLHSPSGRIVEVDTVSPDESSVSVP